MARGNWLVRVLCGIVAVVGIVAAAAAGEPKEGFSLTVYPKFGVVSETRNVEIPAGGEVALTGVAAEIDPATVRFESVTDPAAKVLEQNFQYDIASPGRVLAKYLEKKITVRLEKETCTGTLMSLQEGAAGYGFSPTVQQLLLKDDKGALVMLQGADIRGIQFGQMPEGLRTRPTLLWKVATQKPGKQLARLTYQTDGMGWKAMYNLVVDAKDEHADLAGWVSVDNRSGLTYPNATLKFVAGDVRRVERRPQQQTGIFSEESSAGGGGGGQPEMVEKSFFEYHMYTLQRPSTVADSETKQLELFTPVKEIAVTKRFLYSPLGGERWNQNQNNRHEREDQSYGTDKVSSKVGVFVEFANAKANKLGIPLPAGDVGVYKRNPDDGALELLGEQKIDHTAAEETLTLQIGNAFDLVGERRQTAFECDSGRRWIKESIELALRNHKAEDVTMRIKEPMYRWHNWKITEKSADFIKLDAFNVAFDVKVPKSGEAKVTYTVEYTW